MKATTIFFVFSILLFVAACEPGSCRNDNNILATYGPDESLYKIELGKLLKSDRAKGLVYLFEELRVFNSDTVLIVKLKGEKTCALMQVKIMNWQGIEQIQKSLGKNHKGDTIDKNRITMTDSLVIPIFYYNKQQELTR